MDFHGFHGFHGFSWIPLAFIDFHGFHGFHGFSWISRISWIFMDFIDFHVFPGEEMTFGGIRKKLTRYLNNFIPKTSAGKSMKIVKKQAE